MSGIDSEENVPKLLTSLCLDCLAEHFDEVLFDCYETSSGKVYQLKPGIVFPHQLGDKLLETCAERGTPVNRARLWAFQSSGKTKLEKINLEHEEELTDTDLENIFLVREPLELAISSSELTSRSLELVNTHGRKLMKLKLGSNCTKIFENSPGCYSLSENKHVNGGRDTITGCPNISFLTVNCHLSGFTHVLDQSIIGMKKLSSLDLSDSDVDMNYMHSLRFLPFLQILILHNVQLENENLFSIFTIISRIKTLRVLDLGQSSREQAIVSYRGDITLLMRHLMDGLPKLVWLDISGTNLAGDSHENNEELVAIPWLESRRLDYLGLLNCVTPSDNPCYRQNLPAEKVTGIATEEQILLSLESYIHKRHLQSSALDSLYFHLSAFDFNDKSRALLRIITAMKLYKMDTDIQINCSSLIFSVLLRFVGSACLFLIMKKYTKGQYSPKFTRQIVDLLLIAMENHINDNKVVKNVYLTLELFSLPSDLLHVFERLISMSVRILQMSEHLNIHWSIFHLISSFIQQYDLDRRKVCGQLGVVAAVHHVVKQKLQQNTSDDIMGYAWHVMSCLTDETPANCELFIKEDGIRLFIECLKASSPNNFVTSSLMCIMNNVSEVERLRPVIMSQEIVETLSGLLDKTLEGGSECFNACGILAHMMSDGADAWLVETPTRDEVLRKMYNAILSWDLNFKIDEYYSSLTSLKRLLQHYETPQVQHWAVWSLCNFSNMDNKYYCPMLEKEHALELLDSLIQDDRPCPEMKELARKVVSNFNEYKRNLKIVPDPTQATDILTINGCHVNPRHQICQQRQPAQSNRHLNLNSLVFIFSCIVNFIDNRH